MKMKYLLGLGLWCIGLCAMQDVKQGKVKAAVSKLQMVTRPDNKVASWKNPMSKVQQAKKTVNNFGQAKKPKKEHPKIDLSHSACFDFNQEELAMLVQESWEAIKVKLLAKNYLSKKTYGGVESYESKVGLNKIPGAMDAVKKMVSTEVDNALKKKGSLVLKDLDRHVLGKKNAIALFGVSLKRMMTSAFIEIYSKPNIFGWCTCIPDENRIVLALNVVNDVCRQYKINYRLRYTSIATGSLLQDYIILEELKHRGFKIMTINLIDPGYFSHAEIENLKKLMPLPRDKKHADYLLTMAHEVDKALTEIDEIDDASDTLSQGSQEEGALNEDTSSIFSLDEQQQELYSELYRFIDTVALAQFTKRLKTSDSDIEIIAWENSYDYFERAKKYPKYRSDVFLLIDPETGYFVQPPYPSLANVIRLMPNGNKKEAVYVTIPLHAVAQVWACDQESKNSVLYKEVADLVQLKKATGGLRSSLIEKFSDSKHTHLKLEYIIDLYVLAQDMMYDALAVPSKSVVYMGKEEISKIDPLAYR